MGGQSVHERAHQVVCGEVEDESKGDGDGEGGQSLLEHSKQQEGETQANEDGDKTGQRSVPPCYDLSPLINGCLEINYVKFNLI